MLKEEIERRSRIINDAIKALLPEKRPEGLYKAARHLIRAGGKRLRPVIFTLVSEMLEKDFKRVIPAAISIETIHNFTLVHDDIMDRDEMRRGVPTVHKLFGDSTAILAGDTLFAEAFSLISMCEVDSKNIVEAIRMLANVCIRICEGQFLDLSYENRKTISEEEYLEMVKLKTGTLIAASASMPAILFGERDKVSHLWEFGILSGIGFQIHDDLLDLIGKDIGKDWGSDLVKGKKTLIVIKAFEKGVELESFGKERATKDEIKRDIEKLIDCGAINYAKRMALKFAREAKEKLGIMPNNHAKKIILELTDYLVTREK